MWKPSGQERERARAGLVNLTVAFQLKLTLEDIESLVFAVMYMSGSAVMGRNNALRERVLSLCVLTYCLISEENALNVEALSFAGSKYLWTARFHTIIILLRFRVPVF
jgi:hypothetical protein